MFSIDEAKDSISFKLSSEMKLVDRVVKETRDFSANMGLDESLSGLKIVLRELLINAVEHGNRKLSSLLVKCSVSYISKNICVVLVEDEGEGFNWKELNLKIPDDPNKPRNRGFQLVNTIADKIEFNEKGNVVKAYVTLHMETGYSVSDDGDWKLITPNGDITAASSDKLRELLHTLVQQGMQRCRFDLSNVSDIDSVGLSALIVLSRAIEEHVDARPQLELVNVAPDINRLFEMTMLDSIYKIIPAKTAPQ